MAQANFLFTVVPDATPQALYSSTICTRAARKQFDLRNLFDQTYIPSRYFIYLRKPPIASWAILIIQTNPQY